MNEHNDGMPPMRGGWEWKNAVSLFERQVQLFPLLVVALASASFFWGGCCSIWQWWVAVGLVAGTPFLRRGKWREALGAGVLFMALLVVLKGMLPPTLWDQASFPDLRFYHLPMVQLLAEGWNPVLDPQAEGITSRLGLDLWGMAPLQVAFSNKPLAILAAVAYRFVGDPTGLTVPVLALLWLGVALQALRLYKGPVRWVVLAALIWVLPLVPGRVFMDISLSIAACGLLLTQINSLQRKRCDWLSMGVWTIWMMSIKLNGMLAAFVFISLFTLTKTCQEREDWKKWCGRFAVFGASVVLASILLTWNPIMTSWMTFGHPLYPFKTNDATPGPRPDPTWDLRVVNDDYRAMAKMGIWVREYISPHLAESYYRRKLNRDEFTPRRAWHSMETTGLFRGAFWGIMLVLALHPRGRVIGAGGLLLTMIVPWEIIGYLRYEPWYSALGCVAIALLAEWTRGKMPLRLALVVEFVLFCILACGSCRFLVAHARNVEFKAKELALIRERVRIRFFKNGREPSAGVNPDDFGALYNYLTAQENHCRLLVKALGHEGKTRILTAAGWRPTKGWESLARRPLWKWDQRQWFIPESDRDQRCVEDLGPPWQEGNVWEGFGDPSEAEPWMMVPFNLYWVPLGDHTEHVTAYYTLAEPKPGESRQARLWRRTKHAAKVWGVMYPREVWKWLNGRWSTG